MPDSDLDRADAAIVGASLAGLVAGAILACRGKRVVLLEHADQVGGRGGATLATGGYWVGFGHRDGHDVGDCQLPWHHGAEAAREAGVEIALRRVASPLRLHRFPDDVVLDGASWGAEGLLGGAESWFECPREDVPALRAMIAKLAAASASEREAAIPLVLGDWLDAQAATPGVRHAVLTMATVIFHPRPEEASVGRFMQFLRTPGAGPFIPDDAEAGGMQGLMEPWARAIRERGGEIALGWKPIEISIADGRVCGVVAIDRSNRVRAVSAPVVVATYPLWETTALLRDGALGPELEAIAAGLYRHRADLVGWRAGLQRLPVIRRTGAPDAHAGWNRLLRGRERAYHGGYQVTSLSSRRAAPPGRHLLELAIARFLRAGARAPSWTMARAQVDEALAYLRRFYADLDECMEWSDYFWAEAPQSMSWAWAPVRRHDLTVPSIGGLLLASSTLEAPAGIVDIAAFAGRAAAHEALSQLAR